MFIIRVNEQNHLWENELEDDFLKYLPRHFKLPKEEIGVYYVMRADEFTVRTSDLSKLDLETHAIRVLTWPYNEAGEFTGYGIVDPKP